MRAKYITDTVIMASLIDESRNAHSALRHALQLLRDPIHYRYAQEHGNDLSQCIAACEAIVNHDGDFVVFSREEVQVLAGIAANCPVR